MKTIIFTLLIILCTGCVVPYTLSDAQYSDAREEHASITYYNGNIYWGWNNGFYYYYGTPHYYPWHYYYNTCPPSHYHTTTHVTITNVVNRPRPNWNKPTHRPSHNSNTRIEHNQNNKIIVNKNINKNINKNRNESKHSNKNNRKKRK